MYGPKCSVSVSTVVVVVSHIQRIGCQPEKTTLHFWGMLYADDAGVVSRSQEGLTRMMTIIVEVFGAFGLTVSEKKTETLLIRAPE